MKCPSLMMGNEHGTSVTRGAVMLRQHAHVPKHQLTAAQDAWGDRKAFTMDVPSLSSRQFGALAWGPMNCLEGTTGGKPQPSMAT